MIGSTIKLGLDSQEVKRGLAGLPAMFKGLGGKLKAGLGKVGSGMAMGAGMGLVGLLATSLKELVNFVPEQFGKLGGIGRELKALAGDTDAGVRQIMALKTAFQELGMSEDAAGDMLREFNMKVGEAVKEAGPIRKAFEDLGLDLPFFKDMNLAQQFDAFALAVRSSKKPTRELAYLLDQILGGDLGMKAVGLFKNYGETIADAERRTGGLADALARNSERLLLWPKVGEAIKRKWMEVLLVASEANVVGEAGARGLLGWIESLDVASLGEKVRDTVVWGLEQISGSSLQEVFRGLGRQIGEGFRESISVKSLLGFGGGSSAGAADSRYMKEMLGELKAQGFTLSAIAKKKSGWQ